MNLIFQLDNVISTPAKGIAFGLVDNIKHTKPIEDVVEFMQWAHKEHHITIWCERPNDLAVKYATENWLQLNQVPYDRLLFDRPHRGIDVIETPSHARFYKHLGDLSIVAEMYEEWKNEKRRSSEISGHESQH